MHFQSMINLGKYRSLKQFLVQIQQKYMTS